MGGKRFVEGHLPLGPGELTPGAEMECYGGPWMFPGGVSIILCTALASPLPSSHKHVGWVVCSTSHASPEHGCYASSQKGAPGGSAEMLPKCWRR